MKRKIISLFLTVSSALVAPLPIASVHAQSSADLGGVMVYHFKPNGAVSGLDGMINLDQIADIQDAQRCGHSSAIVTIHTVVYDGTSEIVAGFRTADDTLYRVSIEALYKNVSNAERHLVKDLFKRNQQVLTSYSVCGSGGFIFINEIYKASAIKGLGTHTNGKKESSPYPPSGGSLIRK